jgi:hypothetical protein
MSEAHHLMSLTKNQTKTLSPSLFLSPRLFMGLPPKIFSENDSSMSPTSILDSKVLPTISNSSVCHSTPKKPPSLGLAEALDNNQHDLFNSPKKDRRMVLFGSQLKIQIPSIEFGVKNKETQLALLSPVRGYIFSPKETETDWSEEYTCVISHGPNPRTTHIFDDCVINGDLGGLKLDELLTSCHACKKKQGQGTENAIYRLVGHSYKLILFQLDQNSVTSVCSRDFLNSLSSVLSNHG